MAEFEWSLLLLQLTITQKEEEVGQAEEELAQAQAAELDYYG